MRYLIKIGIEHFALGALVPITVIWKLQNGLSLPEAALTEGLILITTAVLEVPTGAFADRFGNKASIIIGALLHSIATALLAIGGSFEIFVISAVISGLAWAFSSGADEAYIHDDYLDTPNRYQKFFATTTIVDEGATILGMLATSMFLLANNTERGLFWIASILLAALACYIYFILPSGRHANKTISPRPITKIFLGKVRKLIPLFILMLAFAVIYENGRVLWQPHLQDIGISVTLFGLVFSLFKLSAIGGSLLARNRTFTSRDLTIIFIIMSVTLLAFSTNNLWISMGALVIFLGSENYFRIYMSTILNENIVHNRATLLSIGSLFRNVVGGVLVYLLGWMATNSITIAMIFLVVCKIPAIFYLLNRHRKIKTSPKDYLRAEMDLPDQVNH